MKRRVALFAMLALSLALASGEKNGKAEIPAPTKLWVSLSTGDPLIERGKNFMMTFAMVNDSDLPIDPKTESWRLIINGKEDPDSQNMFQNGPRGPQWKLLAAGDHLHFAYAKGDDPFNKPGIYTVVWKGDDFESAPVVFRVR